MTKPQQRWNGVLLCLLLTMVCASLLAKTDSELIKIGVRANRGTEVAVKRWQPTIDYLNQNIAGYHFEMVPYEINSTLNQAASRGNFQFILTNPAAYVELHKRYAVSAMLTLKNKRQGTGFTQFGSVIFTLASREDINSISDLKNKSFMGADELGFGGWRVVWREMSHADVNPYTDLAQLTFGGGNQQNVVKAVLNKKVDAGAVRTDMLERMAAAGKIRLQDIKIIAERKSPQFPFAHSSQLYPEWPFARLNNTDLALANKVKRALLKIKPADSAAIKGKYVGWVPALSYKSVDNLLKELRVGPYANDDISLTDIIVKFWPWLVLLSLFVIALTVLFLRLQRVNQILLKTEHQLLKSNESLHDMAFIDSLTGLGNRRKLQDCIDENWASWCKGNAKVCILLMDIDYFKNYNDYYGHVAGDKCLQTVASEVQKLFRRANEFCIRYGGEEFLVVIQNCDVQALIARSKDFQQSIAKLNIEHSSSPIDQRLTVSIGIASILTQKNTTFEMLVQQADQALYEAKENGRNRIIIAESCEKKLAV